MAGSCYPPCSLDLDDDFNCLVKWLSSADHWREDCQRNKKKTPLISYLKALLKPKYSLHGLSLNSIENTNKEIRWCSVFLDWSKTSSYKLKISILWRFSLVGYQMGENFRYILKLLLCCCINISASRGSKTRRNSLKQYIILVNKFTYLFTYNLSCAEGYCENKAYILTIY